MKRVRPPASKADANDCNEWPLSAAASGGSKPAEPEGAAGDLDPHSASPDEDMCAFGSVSLVWVGGSRGPATLSDVDFGFPDEANARTRTKRAKAREFEHPPVHDVPTFVANDTSLITSLGEDTINNYSIMVPGTGSPAPQGSEEDCSNIALSFGEQTVDAPAPCHVLSDWGQTGVGEREPMVSSSDASSPGVHLDEPTQCTGRIRTDVVGTTSCIMNRTCFTWRGSLQNGDWTGEEGWGLLPPFSRTRPSRPLLWS